MRSKLALAAVALAVAGCGSPAEDRADACLHALEAAMDMEGIKGFTVADNDGDRVVGHVATRNGRGEPSRIDVVCTVDGHYVTVETEPSF